MAGFTTEQRAVIIWRDGGRCCMCGGVATEANHRINRGMGGRRSLNVYANGCALCHDCNRRIEADADYRAIAIERGVKLLDGQDPAAEPWLSPFYRMHVWSLPNGDLTFVAPGVTDGVQSEERPGDASTSRGSGQRSEEPPAMNSLQIPDDGFRS